jgi:nitroreductase
MYVNKKFNHYYIYLDCCILFALCIMVFHPKFRMSSFYYRQSHTDSDTLVKEIQIMEVMSLDTIDSILSRHSVRDFSSRPVAKATIMKILDVSTRSPSGGNSQPWEVFVATGDTIERIRTQCLERARSGAGASGFGGPPPGPDYIQERMKIIRIERLRLLGLDPDDPSSGNVFTEWAQRLYGTPVLVVVCMDSVLSSYLEIGVFVQTVCLAAQDYGVDSFIARTLVSQKDIIQQELEIPDNLNIIIGIALGYADPDSIINTYRSPRRPVQEVVRYKE